MKFMAINKESELRLVAFLHTLSGSIPGFQSTSLRSSTRRPVMSKFMSCRLAKPSEPIKFYCRNAEPSRD